MEKSLNKPARLVEAWNLLADVVTNSLTEDELHACKELFKNHAYMLGNRAHHYGFVGKLLRVIVIGSSFVTPVIIPLMSYVEEEYRIYVFAAAIVFSSAASVGNTLTEALNIYPSYALYLRAYADLREEGTEFLMLTGRYETYTKHSDCWRQWMTSMDRKLNTNVHRFLDIYQSDRKMGKDNLDDEIRMYNIMLNAPEKPSSQSLHNSNIV